jgi:hypothetical protein
MISASAGQSGDGPPPSGSAPFSQPLPNSSSSVLYQSHVKMTSSPPSPRIVTSSVSVPYESGTSVQKRPSPVHLAT